MHFQDKTGGILVVCRGKAGLQSLKKLSFSPDKCYVVASDDLHVHAWARNRGSEVSVVWLEQAQSFYQVVPEVLRIIEEVNTWLQEKARQCSPVRPFARLFFWTRHVEGGVTSQKVQDLLLLINSYFALLEGLRPDEVLLIPEPGFAWEDLVLGQVAEVMHIRVRRRRKFSLTSLRSRLLQYKDYLRLPYYLFHILWIKLQNKLLPIRNLSEQITDQEIHFQLCSSALKHVQNIVPLMQALQREGLRPVAVCWHSSDRFVRPRGAEQIRFSGLPAVELECYLSLSELFSSLAQSLAFAGYLLLTGQKQDFFSCPGLTFRDIKLQPALWPFLVLFVLTEAGQRIRLFSSLKRFYQRGAPLACKLYGGVSLWEGTLAWQVLSSKESPPFLFNYWLGNAIEWPYVPDQEPVDLFLASGELQRDMVSKNLRIPLSKIAVLGQSRYDDLLEFRDTTSRQVALSTLGIKKDFAHYLLFDAGMVLRGFMTASEQMQTLGALLDFAGKYNELAVLIKPHPGHHPGPLEDFVRYSGLKNVFLISKDVSPYPGLLVADLLVTKFSTLGLEAMFFKTGVLSLILDGDRRWQCFGQAAEYFYDLKALLDFLQKFCSDPVFKSNWLDEQAGRQERFLQQMLGPARGPVASLQARVLIEAIAKRGGSHHLAV